MPQAKQTILRFGAVGLFNTLLGLLLLNIFVFLVGLKPGWSNILAISITMCISFFLNLRFVFRNGSIATAGKFALFVAVTLFCQYVVNQAIFLLCMEIFASPMNHLYPALDSLSLLGSATAEFYLVNFSKIIAVGVTAVSTYYLYSRVVFRKDASEKQQQDTNQHSHTGI